MNLAEIRQKWIQEKTTYTELGDYSKDIITEEIRKIGIQAIVSYRTKDIDKLLKKALRKQYRDPYKDITDKLGVRVILSFRKYIPAVQKIIADTFDILKTEDKMEELGVDRWGYQGVHYDVRLRDLGDEKQKKFKELTFEIQLQTVCQNVWCELNHSLYYNKSLNIPDDYIRSINRLSALLETADIEFERTYTMISGLASYKEIRLLEILEKYYFQFYGNTFDRELSLNVLEILCKSYDDLSAEKYENRIDSFIKSNRASIEQIIKDYETTPDRSLFLFQPECPLILVMIEEDPFKIKNIWEQYYPLDELERLAAIFGRRLS